MVIPEFKAETDRILDDVDRQVRQLADGGAEARYILLGPAAYSALCRGISIRNQRGKGTYETYNYLQIVIDPFRDDTICVLPPPQQCAEGVRAFRVDDE